MQEEQRTKRRASFLGPTLLALYEYAMIPSHRETLAGPIETHLLDTLYAEATDVFHDPDIYVPENGQIGIEIFRNYRDRAAERFRASTEFKEELASLLERVDAFKEKKRPVEEVYQVLSDALERLQIPYLKCYGNLTQENLRQAEIKHADSEERAKEARQKAQEARQLFQKELQHQRTQTRNHNGALVTAVMALAAIGWTVGQVGSKLDKPDAPAIKAKQNDDGPVAGKIHRQREIPPDGKAKRNR